jgi:hypothetical protein
MEEAFPRMNFIISAETKESDKRCTTKTTRLPSHPNSVVEPEFLSWIMPAKNFRIPGRQAISTAYSSRLFRKRLSFIASTI